MQKMTGKRAENVLEIRAFISGRPLLGLKAKDIHREVCVICGEGQILSKTICMLVAKFQSEQQQLKDAARLGCPVTSKMPKIVDEIREMLKTDAYGATVKGLPLSQDLKFREASRDDKSTILSLRHNVYRGLDYLPDQFDYFLRDANRRCIVGELDGTLVSFGVILFLDGGESILGQAGRVHELYEGHGIFGAMNQHFNKTALEHGCKRRVALVETSFNKYARSEKFKLSHVEIASKLHYVGVVTEDIRQKLEDSSFKDQQSSDIINIASRGMHLMFNSEQIRNALFPRNRILLDFAPFRCIDENVCLLSGRNTYFYSTVRMTSNDVTGLLTAGSSFKCTNPPESYTIDIFGTDFADLENHLHFHLMKAVKQIPREFCLQIFIERGYIAQKLCEALMKLGIPKCDWFVRGGVTTKTIVEEVLR